MNCISRRTFAVVAFLFGVLASPVKATTVAAVITPDQIVLAADSLLSSGTGEAIALTHKNNVYGHTTVAVAGLVQAGSFVNYRPPSCI